jgi:hypothetical protein
MEDTDNMQTLLDNWNEIRNKIYEQNREKSNLGEIFHKEFYEDTTKEKTPEEKARENFEKELESEGILAEFLEFEEEKHKQSQALSHASNLEKLEIDKAYKAIMKPIYDNWLSEHEKRKETPFGVWLPQIETKLSKLANENFGMLNYEEKKRIIAEQANSRGNPLTLIQIQRLFNQLYEEKEEIKRERERERAQRESKNESLEELYHLYKLHELTIQKADKFKQMLADNPDIDTSFILDRDFTPFAKAIHLDPSVIKTIRRNRFNKKWWGKGGKTKRRKNKKTKRRKNKKTKRRK